MDKFHTDLFGKRLRKEFAVPNDLPYPLKKALEALARSSEGDGVLPATRGGNAQDPTSTSAPLARDND